MGTSPHLETIFDAKEAVEEAVDILSKNAHKIKIGNNTIIDSSGNRRNDKDPINSAVGWWIYLSDTNRKILEDLRLRFEVEDLMEDLVVAEDHDPLVSKMETWDKKKNVIIWFKSFLSLLETAVDAVMWTTVRP